MINRRSVLSLFGGAAGALAAPSIVRAQQVKTLRMGHIFPETHPYHIGLTTFAKEVEKLTSSSVKVDVYTSGQLGGEIQMIEGMGLGTVDGGVAAAGSLAQTHALRKFYLLDMPYLFKSYDGPERFIESDVARELESLIKPGSGVKILGWGCSGFNQMINKQRPINVPGDLAGLKFRVWESPSAKLSFELMGMSPTPMPYVEVFTSIQQGVVDGLVNSLTTFHLTKMYEVAKYVTVSDQLYVFIFMLCSERSFEALTSDEQKAVEAAAAEGCKVWRSFYPSADNKYREILAQAGCSVNDIDKNAFIEHVRPQYRKYVDIVHEPGTQELIDRMTQFSDI